MKLLIDYTKEEIVSSCKTDSKESQDICLAVLEDQEQLLRDSDKMENAKTNYLEEFQKEIRTMLNDFVGVQNTQSTKDIIKIKTQEIFDKYKIVDKGIDITIS